MKLDTKMLHGKKSLMSQKSCN